VERRLRDTSTDSGEKDQDLRVSKAQVLELQTKVEQQVEEIERLKNAREIESERAADFAHDYERASGDAERLRAQLDEVRGAQRAAELALEDAQERLGEMSALRAQLRARESPRRVDVSIGRSQASADSLGDQREIEALQADLDAAHAEIGRLQFAASNSTVRDALTRSKDARLADLERRNAELEDELSEVNRFVKEAGALSQASLGGDKTPLAMRQTMARINNLIRTPKTPGAALKEVKFSCYCTYIL
jgi:chromosome segregation ATPase